LVSSYSPVTTTPTTILPAANSSTTILPATNSPTTVTSTTIPPAANSPTTITPIPVTSETVSPVPVHYTATPASAANNQVSGSATSNSSDTPRETHPVVLMTIHFELLTENLDMTSLYCDYDAEAHKSCFYMPEWPPEIEEAKVLYIPIGKVEDTDDLSIYVSEQCVIYICPNATTLDEVYPQAPGTIFLRPGEIRHEMMAYPFSYKENMFYVVEGIISGGGGILVSNNVTAALNDMQ
jgi:hypothetical protein